MDDIIKTTSTYGCSEWNNIYMNSLITYLSREIDRIYNFKNSLPILAKCDTNLYVILFNNYIIRLTLNVKEYQKLFEINRRINTIDPSYKNIERSSIFTSYNILDKFEINKKIYVIVSFDYLNPIFHFKYNKIISNIDWNYDNFKKFLYDVADGLEILHRLNIEHGDLTPDNIGYRESSNNFVIFDFGASKIHDIKPNYNFYLKDIQKFMKSLQTTYGGYFIDFDELYVINSSINELNIKTPYDFKKIVNNAFVMI